MNLFRIILVLYVLLDDIIALDPKDVVFVILSQISKYHVQQAENLKNDIFQQAEAMNKKLPIVHLVHEDFPHVGSWTILPLLPRIYELHSSNSSWIFFLEDRTKIKLPLLISIISNYDPKLEIWFGHALHDREATIIHHFMFHENPKKFRYPNIASGFIMSIALIKSISLRFQTSPPKNEFNIDSSHELALFIWNENDEYLLKHEPLFCTKESSNCATFPILLPTCDMQLNENSIYFAVKTCQKFKDRLTVVKNTWGKYAKRITYFSDIQDETVPTISLGIPNTEQGHCGKTMAILRYVNEELQTNDSVQWIVVTDDDTILSVSRIHQYLSCFNSNDLTALGERYGFNVYTSRGYNYITGGGGMVFSRPLIQQLTAKGVCECPSNNTPDDMFLGICIAGLGAQLLHSPFFHQARPVDYSKGFLESQYPISFHKHWMIDPVEVYERYFANVDSKYATKAFNETHHVEL